MSWRVLSQNGIRVEFATPHGARGRGDELMLTGKGLDPWGFLPLLNNVRLFGLILRANRDARHAYARLEDDAAFRNPKLWNEIRVGDYDAILLPGGHRARGMREYLESNALQRVIVGFFGAAKPVAAICHGVLLAARSIDPETRRSVLYGRKTTALTWALERSAARLGAITRFWDPNYYRTYPEERSQPVGYMSTQAEVTRALASPTDFLDVPPDASDYHMKTSGLSRDSATDSRPAWVVCDGNYVSARWPGDVFTFATTFARVLRETHGTP